MNQRDALQELLTEFFELPPETAAEALRQDQIAKWDSLAMVHLIVELQGRFNVEFDIQEIGELRSYDEIRAALVRKGIL